MRILSTALTTALLLTSATAFAATDPKTWNRDIERLDYYLNPPQGGDNDFFTTYANASDKTNVVLLYPASWSMGDFTQKLYKIRVDLGGGSPTGCTNTYLNNLTYFMPTNANPPAGALLLQGVYSSLKVYPQPFIYSGGKKGDKQDDKLDPTKVYRWRNWPVGDGGGNLSGTPEAKATACGFFGANAAACEACIDSNGYWLNPLAAPNDVTANAGVFGTNWLRFHPTKWVLMELAYKRLVHGPLLAPLREAVVVTNGTTGGKVTQKMLPESCNGKGRPLEEKLKATDDVNYNSAAKPLAEMLFNGAWYMGGQENSWVFNNACKPGSDMNQGKSGPCNSCNADFMILFSDGRGDTANPACAGAPASCTAASACSTLGMGAEDDGNDFALDPLSGVGPASLAQISAAGIRVTPAGTCDLDFADDVAGWMSTSNVSAGPMQPSKVRTFVVGLGDPANTYGEMSILPEIASRGNGSYVVADDFVNLEAKIELVFKSLRASSTSFSSTAVTTVQTSGVSSAFIPRFKPSTNGAWSGTLSRFALFNEFSAGCLPSMYGTKTPENPNGDSSCTDFYLKDYNGDFIRENSLGNFGVVDTTQPYDAGWPLIVTADGGIQFSIPFWEANQQLNSREDAILAGPPGNPRQIWTVAQNGTTGAYDPTLVPFTVANVANITPLLQLGGVDGEFCTSVAGLTSRTYATEDECAADLIAFIHGEDLRRDNPYNRSSPPPSPLHSRLNIMGDIFHSSPILVVPPVPKFLCDLGFVNQCVASLYSPTLTPGGAGTGGAYATWFNANQYRSQSVLIGANDGLLHSFNAANDVVVGVTHSFDTGTGDENWAFIPPDMLPKLVRYMTDENHNLLVDGTPMVRDIWVDGSGASLVDYAKQSDEYHTIVIIGEREGGRGYLALDVTDPATPRFLWSWPKPGTTEALSLGFSWNDIGASPPAIGPIAKKDVVNGPFSVGGFAAVEQYVVAFGGGYEPSLVRGRSIHVLDAWTGTEVFRYSRQDSTGVTDPRNAIFPVAAPVSMIDTDGDGLFDIAVVGDTAGPVWTVAMGIPGEDTNADGRYDNWFAARTFSEFRVGASASSKRSPFFHRAVTAKFPSGELRVYLGGGDRDHIKAVRGGLCGPASLLSCMRQDCDATVTETAYSIGPAPLGIGGHTIAGGWALASGGIDTTNTLSYVNTAQSSVNTDVASATTTYTFANCGSGVGSGTVVAPAWCDFGVTDAGTDCPIQDGLALGSPLDAGTTVLGTGSYFYSIKLFDAAGARAKFVDPGTTTAYDNARLTETNLIDAASTTAIASGNGWYLLHNHNTDEKTAASALLFGGCVIWNTLNPNPNPIFACGSPSPTDTAWAYQADAISGGISCGLANSTTALNTTVRSVSRQVTVTPSSFTPVASVSPSGQILYSAVGMDPQAPVSSTSIGSSAIQGMLEWLEVPRKIHDCRHFSGTWPNTQCQ